MKFSPACLRRRPLLILAAILITGINVHAATIALPDSPLGTATAAIVKPNLMFVLDDSGSMELTYMPDGASSTTNYRHRNSAYNSMAYNPAVRYEPPAYVTASGAFDTTTYLSQDGSSSARGGVSASAASPNWQSVKYDAYGVITTAKTNLTEWEQNPPFAHVSIPGEHCDSKKLNNCTTSATPTGAFVEPSYMRWCNGAGTSCQSGWSSGTFNSPRIPGSLSETTINAVTAGHSVTGLTVSGQQLLPYTVTITLTGTAATDNHNMAIALVTAINRCTNEAYGNCTISGYSASVSQANSATVRLHGPGGISVSPVLTRTNVTVSGPSNFNNGPPGVNVAYMIINYAGLDVPYFVYPGTSAKHADRTDCASTKCTYREEMTNYANWYTYYRTRLNTMKTATALGFKDLDGNYRVGYTTINNSNYSSGSKFLAVAPFETSHKKNWYDKLLATNAPNSTPLRQALGRVGKYFANKLGSPDPMEYSCQKNYMFLSTDGYWNDGSPATSLTNTTIPNMDGGAACAYNAVTCSGTRRPMHEGTTAQGTLADMAKYFYDTDLRTPLLNNCGSSPDRCENNVPGTTTHQNMVTFTMGLGTDGRLQYQDDYPTATTGDFYNLKNGIAGTNWPDPLPNFDETRGDDLWHAAVNGGGRYFSARNPKSIRSGIRTALSEIQAKLSFGAAAASTTLAPIVGDNSIFVGSYVTGKWTGNLVSKPLNVDTGALSETATWCLESLAAETCPAPGTVQIDSSGGSLVYNCVGSGLPTFEIANACTGTMGPRVATATDTRTIYKANAAKTALVDFTWANLTASEQSSMDGSQLTQYTTSLSPAQQAIALNGQNMMAFLRGQTGFEKRSANTANNQVYRLREAVIGDIIESAPVYNGASRFSYTDTGYSTYKSTALSVTNPSVYIGANDGMLHAINSTNGAERWAFVPSAVIPKMYKLADFEYDTGHKMYVNGTVTVADVDFGVNDWHTILVGGLNGGGRSYYALDVTNPAVPKLLWEIDQNTHNNLGYSYGRPIVTKLPDGTWVVILATGYNNVSPGNGQGYIYVLNAKTGALIKTYSTGVGSTTTPSGLAHIEAWVDEALVDNTAKYIYGGDLLGNVWRVDLATDSLMKFAYLKDPSGNPQAITTPPVLGEVDNHRAVFITTGKLLEATDLLTTQVNSVYGMQDKDETSTFDNPRTQLTKQAYKLGADTSTLVNDNPQLVDWDVSRGWYADLYDAPKARVFVPPKLFLGFLQFASFVPDVTDCSPGGNSWFYQLDYRTGLFVTNAKDKAIAKKFAGMIVGFTSVLLGGKNVAPILTVNNNNTCSTCTPDPVPLPDPTGFKARQAVWRPLLIE